VIDCYEQACAVAAPTGRLSSLAVRHGFAPADRLPRVPAERLPRLEPARPSASVPVNGKAVRTLRRAALLASCSVAAVLALLALQRIGVGRVAASVVASSPGLVLAGVALMCASMLFRAIAWHAILVSAPTWRRARRRDAMQGTFIGVLMSATLPARLGEPTRALVVARRLGRARETLPVVLGTMVSQTLLNLLALAGLWATTLSGANPLDHRALLVAVIAPVGALLILLVSPLLVPVAFSRSSRAQVLSQALRSGLARLRDGLRVFRNPRQAALAAVLQLSAWSLQWLSCWVLLVALGLGGRAGLAGAAAVLFAVNVTAVVPATPANVGVFQAACVAVLAGAYHVSTPDAIAYGIVLQAVEIFTALVMGLPALVNEGLSWREVRLRTIHATPVKLAPLPSAAIGRAVASRSEL
jgi:phosphatidylinositol alpha-mannosyltransferase